MIRSFSIKNEEFKLIYEMSGHFLDFRELKEDDEKETVEEWNPFNKLLYRSDNAYVLIENETFEEEEEDLCDPYELLTECLLEDYPHLYVRAQLYDAIEAMSRRKGLILNVYQFYDDTVNFFLIDDMKLYRRLKKINASEAVRIINDYIARSLAESDDHSSWICARITDGKYEKYEV